MPSESGVHDVQHDKPRQGADMVSWLLLSTIGYVVSATFASGSSDQLY